MPLRMAPPFVALHFGAVVWWSLKGLQCSLKTFAVWVGELNGSLRRRRRWGVEEGKDEVESGGWVRLLTRLLMKNALELKRQASRGPQHGRGSTCCATKCAFLPGDKPDQGRVAMTALFALALRLGGKREELLYNILIDEKLIWKI